MHFRHHAFHHFDRTRRAGHDAGAQRGEIKLFEIGMVKFGDEHRGHAVQRGATLLCHTLQSVAWAEVRRGQNHRRAVRDADEVAEHHAEAMIERHGNAQPVAMCEAHPLANEEGVVEDVVVRKHRALRETRRAGGVLDVNDVVEFERGLALGELGRRDAVGEGKQLAPRQHSLWRLFAEEQDAPQVWKFCCAQSFVRIGVG